MKKVSIVLSLIFLFLVGCSAIEPIGIAETQNEAETISDLPEPIYRLTLDHMGHGCYGPILEYDNYSANNEQLSVDNQMWQDAYAEMLRDLSGNDFYLCDIDENGIPELLIGGPSTDTDKHTEFDVYTYKERKAECLGTVSTLRWSSFWLDENGGILGYSYGAGAGGTYRYYIDNDILCYDGEVSGYYYDSEGIYIEWFKGSDGSDIIITDENRHENENILNSMRVLERYTPDQKARLRKPCD